MANYAIEVSDYYKDGFKVFRRWASQTYPDVDFSRFIFYDNSRSLVATEVVKVEEDGAED